MNKLLILDISGVLCCKLDNSITIKLPIIMQTQYYKVVSRPYVDEFFAYVFENYNIAFFSSTAYHNAKPILDYFLSPKQQKRCVFLWFRDRTHFDPDSNGHDTIKKLSDVIDNPIINSNKKYTYDNTMICDDSSNKMRFNPAKNVIICEEFCGDVDDDYLLRLMSKLKDEF